MKRFVWRLQRLLDVKIRQHEMLRADLVSLTEQATTVRAQILMLKAQIRNRLTELRTLAAAERLHKQQMFLQFAHVLDTRMKTLSDKLMALEQQRKEKLRQLLEIRRERKSLEKLRAKAMEEYRREQNHEEQVLTDETSCTAYARSIILSHETTVAAGHLQAEALAMQPTL
ncbi:MAG: flagellar FliJ family protein [Anaerohalosphaeraceae bacterium]